jgi:hypothetical protein
MQQDQRRVKLEHCSTEGPRKGSLEVGREAWYKL